MCDCNCGRDRELIQTGLIAEIRLLITNATTDWSNFMATANERLAALTAQVSATNEQLDKVKGEITEAADKVAAELATLREQIQNGTVDEESLASAEAAVTTLREKTQGLDDVHADPENPEPEPTPEPEPEPAPEPEQPAEPQRDGFGNIIG